ncbi:sugar ABC transporter substrate-binding protein [Streptomyces asiaticus]|uniref:sugar ABC transporter substrate-binding protein n=1 Tax=Streptomyces asiaticus TaxID=114695 RepID=UPI003D7173B5
MKARVWSTFAAVTAGFMAVSLAGCGNDGEPSGDGFTVGLLLPSREVPRYEQFDRPLIEKRVKALCAECHLTYANAGDDVTSQQRQMDSMITKGVGALILDAVDVKALRSSVTAAHKAGIPVVAYDRLAEGPVSGYATFNGATVGKLQGKALLDALGSKAGRSQIVIMNGDPVSPNAGWFTRGTLSAIRGKVKIARSYDIVDYRKSTAHENMAAAIAALGPGRIDGVLAANDSIAAGVVSALKAARISPLPPVTGQDADLSAVRRVVKGDQYMTVYKPFRAEADAAATMAVALRGGQKLEGIARTTVDSPTTKDIPAALLTPVAVTADNIKQTLVKDGVYTIDKICTPELRHACDKAGLTH